MTNLKTVEASVEIDRIAPVEQPQPVVKTQEFPAIDPAAAWELEGTGPDAVPSMISEGDITVPVDSSIETALTFESLRRQSIEDDEDRDEKDDGKP